MKINQKEIMILSVNQKKKQDGTDYVSISFASIDDGTPFTVSAANLDLLLLEPFSKHLADFSIADSKYGMRLTLENID